MSDSQKPGGGDPTDATKRPDSALRGHQPPAGTMSVSQHVFIWTLVILVGVIFGVGPSLADVVRQPANKIAGTDIDESDAVRRMQVAQRLQRIIDPTGYERRFAAGSIDDHARRILIERYADAQGLKPSGKVLDRLVDEFLARPLPGGRPGNYQSAINEFRRNRVGDVTVPELERYLAEEFAVNAVFARNIHVPAVPLAVAGQFERMINDKVEVEEATLSARSFLNVAAIEDQDPELRRMFDDLRNSQDKSLAERLMKPAVALVTVASVDMAALLEKQPQPTDAEIQAWYDSHREDYREPAKPIEPSADPTKPVEPTYKPLEIVKAEIAIKLKNDAVGQRASEVLNDFLNGEEFSSLDGSDAVAFKTAAESAGLKVTDVEIEEPRAAAPELVLPGIGRLKQGERELSLFSRPAGFVSGVADVVAQGDQPGARVVLRLNDRRDRQARELSEPDVLAEVKRRVAGRRAYVEFLAAAEKLRAEAESKGPGGLRAVLESEAGKTAWPDAKLESRSLRALDDVRPPAQEIGGLSDDAKPVLAYAMPQAPVALAQATNQDEVPSVRILQVKSYVPGSPTDGAQRQQMASYYREGIQYFAQREFSDELQRRIFE